MKKNGGDGSHERTTNAFYDRASKTNPHQIVGAATKKRFVADVDEFGKRKNRKLINRNAPARSPCLGDAMSLPVRGSSAASPRPARRNVHVAAAAAPRTVQRPSVEIRGPDPAPSGCFAAQATPAT